MTGIVETVGQAMRRWFQPERKAPPLPRRAPSRIEGIFKNPPVSMAPGPVDDFEASLSAALEKHSNVSVGRVHLVNVAALREEFGPKWNEIGDQALEIITTCIKENLRIGDFYEPHGETAFVIVLPNAREHEAAICLNRIRRAIGMKLMGKDEPGELVSVKSASVKTDGKVIFKPTKKLDDLLSFVDQRESGSLPPHMVRLLEQIQREEPADPLEEIRILYRPMWHVERDTVSSYILVPCREIARGQFATGRALFPPNPTTTMLAELDTLLVEAAANELIRLQQSGALITLTIPIHLETLSAANLRQAYLRIVEGMLGSRKRLVVFEIHELSQGVPQSRLFDIVNYLTPHCRAVCCRFRPGSVLEDSLQGAGFFACGLDIKGHRQDPSKIKNLFDQFHARCSGLGLKSYLHGAATAPVADLAAGCGFTFVDGEAVEGLTRHPSAMHRFNRRDLFGKIDAQKQEVAP